MSSDVPRLTIERVGPEAAAPLLAIVQAAFSVRPPLDPPADALSETEATMKEHLAAYGGLLARLDGEPVGGLVLDPAGKTVWLRRFAVLPDRQGHGIAHKLISRAAEVAGADGYEDLAVVAREELPRTVRFWDRQGFREIDRPAPLVRMHRPLNTYVLEVVDADAMRELGRRLSAQLRAGDLLVLTGELGAGKTTFTQGLGAGLGVRGAITSPTFVIARVHPNEGGGPELVHVDAYRLGSMAELDDLDLDTDLDEAVTVVEWGEGIAEGLAESRLEIRIVRALADEEPLDDPEDPDGADPRRVEITPVGPRWHRLDVSGL
ncbi:tRNA (adenosine(37)-N6)-threonylcarbamoyltransferase complex ATPase subunit type 1 TsaE [Nocardioides sp. KR10-350]|uniref:tRNA (adenosine(37)-N6)-threonylcarbamoyltransferase complex ATPase subunit type 1 TsaE n=1 Tax=Nocardioides cheoyonin TaxID=3156615 RepID=UPI0032B52259